MISIEKKELTEHQYCFHHLLENSSPILYLLLASHVVSLLACQATDSAITRYCWRNEPEWAAENGNLFSPMNVGKDCMITIAQDHLRRKLIYYQCVHGHPELSNSNQKIHRDRKSGIVCKSFQYFHKILEQRNEMSYLQNN